GRRDADCFSISTGPSFASGGPLGTEAPFGIKLKLIWLPSVATPPTRTMMRLASIVIPIEPSTRRSLTFFPRAMATDSSSLGLRKAATTKRACASNCSARAASPSTYLQALSTRELLILKVMQGVSLRIDGGGGGVAIVTR